MGCLFVPKKRRTKHAICSKLGVILENNGYCGDESPKSMERRCDNNDFLPLPFFGKTDEAYHLGDRIGRTENFKVLAKFHRRNNVFRKTETNRTFYAVLITAIPGGAAASLQSKTTNQPAQVNRKR